jgi:benzoyl-CoA reductase subunit C
MWTMLFPGRYVRYVDVPQNFDPKVGGAYWRRELETLQCDLTRLAGRSIKDDELRHSIAIYNQNRQAIRELYQARSRQPWVYPTSELYLFLRAGNVLPPEEHTELLRQYLKLAPLEEDRKEKDHSRVVLVGMFCEQPPLGLLLTLERAGCWIVDDDLLLGMRWLTGEVEVEGDPLANLVTAFLEQSTATASRYQPEGDRGRALVESVQQNVAEGVIFCAPSFCDPALLDQPMLIAALDRESIQHTQFKYSEDTGQFAVIREQAGTFSDSIRLWSEA